MTKTPSQLKNLTEEWIQDLGYKVTDVSDKNVNDIEWALQVGDKTNPIGIFIAKKSQDFIVIQMEIKFGQQHVIQTGKMEVIEYNNFVLKLTDRMTTYGVDWIVQHGTENEKEILSLTMKKFLTVNAFNKNALLQLVQRCLVVRSQIKRTIEFHLNKNQPIEISSTHDNQSQMYG